MQTEIKLRTLVGPLHTQLVTEDTPCVCSNCGDSATVRTGELWPAYCICEGLLVPHTHNFYKTCGGLEALLCDGCNVVLACSGCMDCGGLRRAI